MKDDSTAEELAVYSFSLLGASETVLDPSQSARQAQITVVASDDPYGIIQFQSASSVNVSEDVGFVNLTVVRNGGSIGYLSVNFSVSSTTATKGVDYESFGSGMVLCCVVFVCLMAFSHSVLLGLEELKLNVRHLTPNPSRDAKHLVVSSWRLGNLRYIFS